MKWFMLIMFVHISQYGLEQPSNVKFIKIDKEYNSMQECIDDQPKQTIDQIKKFDFDYDWKVASCTNSKFTIYIHPNYPNKTKDIIQGVPIKYGYDKIKKNKKTN